MKNILKLGIILTIFFFPTIVSASNATISVSNSRNSAIVGNSVRTTVTVSSSENLGGWEFDLNYDSDRLRFTGSSFDDRTRVVDTATSGDQKSKTYTFDFVTTSSGRARIYVTNSEVISFDEDVLAVQNGEASVNIMTQAEYQATLSGNNFLKSLSVEDYELDPEFDKETLEYTIKLAPETEQIVLKGELDDSKASVDGLGERTVVDGENELKIEVTAENGDKRTYIINAVVEDLEPISLTINGQEYSLIREMGRFVCPDLFEIKSFMFDDEDVPSCFSEDLNMRLIATRDDNGDRVYFIVDGDDLIKYRQIVFQEIVFFVMDFPADLEIPSNYSQITLTINGLEVIAYRDSDNRDFNLIYGKNLNTGEEGLYRYDSEEKTIQRYVVEEKAEETTDDSFLTMILGIISGILFIATIVLIIQLKKANKLLAVSDKLVKKHHKFEEEPEKEEAEQEQEEIEEEDDEELTDEEDDEDLRE